MIVSWEWLGQYVALAMPLEELTTRLTMSGLNLEGTESFGDDTAIDLEVTSNRPDCLWTSSLADSHETNTARCSFKSSFCRS